MFELSTAISSDFVLNVVAFLVSSFVVYFLVSHMTKEFFEVSYLKIVLIMAMAYSVKLGLNQFDWTSPWPVALSLLFLISGILVLGLIELNIKQGLIVSAVFVLMAHAGSFGSTMVYDFFFPGEPSIGQYIGLVRPDSEGQVSRQIRSVAHESQDEFNADPSYMAVFSQQNCFDLFNMDVNHVKQILNARSLKLNRLSDKTMDEYRRCMAVGMVENAVATRRQLLAAMKKTDPVHVVLSASILHAQSISPSDQQSATSVVPMLMKELSSAFHSFRFTPAEEALFYSVVELIYLDGARDAVAKLEEEAGSGLFDPAFIGTLAAAVIQSEADVPMDIILQDPLSISMLNRSSLKSLASSHWKQQGKDPEMEWKSAITPPVKPAEQHVAEVPEVGPNPFIRVTTPMGAVLVPNETMVTDEWIAAASMLKVKGFVSLDGEVAVLSTTGVIIQPGKEWKVDFKDYTYAFQVDSVEKNRVSMQAIARKWNL